MSKAKPISPKRKKIKDKKGNARQPKLEPSIHRRILRFVNEAIYPEDIAYEKMTTVHDEGSSIHEDNLEEMNPTRGKILGIEIAKEIIEFRDREYPLGFRNLNELFAKRRFDRNILDILLIHFGHVNFGQWVAFPVPIPRRGPGGIDGVVHAALLHTGKVLFITADETTLLWDPENTTPATFEDPVNQPHQTPDAESGYSVLCGGHSFLSDGRLLVVGGGGYGPHDRAVWGYKFDPMSKTWTRTGGRMAHHRWYPTVLTMGDQRMDNSHEVLVTCGHGAGDMEIYDEGSDSFRQVTGGDDKPFPNLYPGLHLLPNHSIFYSRTGWGSAEAGGGPFPSPTGGDDDQSAYFVFTSADTGVWNNIATVSPSMPDRTKGMSVMLLSNTAPYVRVMVVGGSDPSTNSTYESIDATSLSSATNWSASMPFPDGEHRSLGSAVLLPDGTVFVCGGIQRPNSPSTLFKPQTNSWSPLAELPSIRDYHSVAVLLPSGKVMMAGWNNTTIEIYSPPYLFRGPRPVISSAPTLVHHGQNFVIESPDASSIVKMVLVRPMAVTHQTDTEQKVLEMQFIHDKTRPRRLKLTAPDGRYPYSLAQQGYYMMFAIKKNGVPSVAKWIYLQVPSILEEIYVYVLVELGKKEPDPVIYLKTIKGIDKPLSQDKDKAMQQLGDIRKQLTDQFKNGNMEKSAFHTLDKAISKLIDRISKRL
jgi:hypothetical protein